MSDTYGSASDNAILTHENLRLQSQLKKLNNLLSNAIKYTPRGVVELGFSCVREDGEIWLDCRVEDSGIGISEENIPKLFADYQQVDILSHRTIEGTGLGLSICKRLVLMMNGSIEVESEYGRGSKFSVRIRQGVIGSFTRNMPKLLETLRDVTESTLSEYAVNVHGAKGSCYGICADEAGRMAEALEISAKSGDFARVLAGNETFIAGAGNLIMQLEALLKSANEIEEAADSAKSALPSPARPLLNKLLDASRDYDIDTMQSAMDELDQHSYESEGELISWLKEQLANFGCDAISDKLDEMLK
jgi:hypothetical protein